MNRTQLFSIGAVAVLIGGTSIAVHFDRERHIRAMMASHAKSMREPDMFEPDTKKTAAVPMSLTASDGTGLVLKTLAAKVVADDPLAFTELRLVFENPLDRAIEGTFSITLPQGASVGRFAMKLGELWQEGEVVEKQAARRAYEDFLHRRQDPALLEQGAGNEFTARVFPIPARGKKELIISYSQELGGRAYSLPLHGLPSIGAIDIVATDGAGTRIGSLQKESFVPTEDFLLGHDAVSPGLRAENLVVARVYPIPDSQPDLLSSVVILFDTSASRGLGFEDQIALLQRLVTKIAADTGASTPISVACFDQATEQIYIGEASGFGEKELAKIRERGALGASNIENALAWAADHSRRTARKRVLMITDGVATAGEAEADKLAANVVKLKADGIERLDAITVGGIRDDGALRRMTTAGLLRDGAVLDGHLVATALVRRLNEATRSHIPVTVAGATWSYPTSIDGVQAGDEVLVYAEVPAAKANVDISVGDLTVPVALRPASRPLLERAWAKAKIESLVAGERASGSKPETQKAIVDLSVRHRVTSPYTSFLVLETEEDYARFKIDRDALSDILGVDDGRLAIHHRGKPDFTKIAAEKQAALAARPAEPAAPATPTPTATATAMASAAAPPAERAPEPSPPRASTPAPGSANGSDPLSARGNVWGDAVSDAFGAGGLGLSGAGEGGGGRGEGIGLGNVGTLGHGAGTGTGQGFGNGHGRLSGSHQTGSPSLRQGAVTVMGRLPPEVIQRIVRQNFGRFRLCYENGLRNNPSLSGRITVSFVIGRDGAVMTTRDGGSELPDAAVVNCVVRGFANLSFPVPEAGIVTVGYPIIFNPPEDAPDTSGDSGRGGSEPAAPPEEKPARTEPYAGKFKLVMDALAQTKKQEALELATKWRAEAPGDVMALTALGESYEALGDFPRAERAYGSVIDLFSSRADLRRFAGARLERIKDAAAQDLALDSFEKAAIQRPDHPQSHRLVAYALLRKRELSRAFDAAKKGSEQKYPSGRFAGVDQILKEDLGLIAAAWMNAEPKRSTEILDKLKAAGGTLENAPSLRFILNWETDANDVDFHIYDDKGAHAFFSNKTLPNGGGELYADVTTGYGPECFTIRKPPAGRAGSYTLQANYYSIGPMGYGMGKLEIIDHDGKGTLTFEERPYVVMVDHAFVDLGTVKR